MYLTLEKFDSYSDGVAFNSKVFLTLEHAKAYALATYQSHLDDLHESETIDYESSISEYSDGTDTPIMYTINVDEDYYFCIQIQKIPDDDVIFNTRELIELSDSN